MKAIPKATLIEASGARTIWRVEFHKGGQVTKAYRATTYPNSDLVFLENAESRRVIASFNARKILVEIRQAIAVAIQQAQASSEQKGA
jgi:hypothetical protein